MILGSNAVIIEHQFLADIAIHFSKNRGSR
nr:MAG TPA: hypothetical protein [Crassvirales sp.]